MPGRRRDHLTHAPYRRTARVNEVLREVVADELERLADTDERLSLVTVTGIQTASDLSHATVFMSSLDPACEEALNELRSELQRAIGTQVRMKRTPLLEFAADPAVAQGLRVEEILRRVQDAPADDEERE